jgi:hypothetical protein
MCPIKSILNGCSTGLFRSFREPEKLINEGYVSDNEDNNWTVMLRCQMLCGNKNYVFNLDVEE